MDFQNFQKSNFDGGKFFIHNLPWVLSNKKFGPDRFSRFDVYWIQTDRQAKFIYRRIFNCQKDLKYYLRFYTFWATAAGQKVSGFLLISGSILSAVYQIAPHTVLIKFVRDYYQNLTYGIPTPVRYSCVHLYLLLKIFLDFVLTLFVYSFII